MMNPVDLITAEAQIAHRHDDSELAAIYTDIAYLVENISREKVVRVMQTVIATHNETDKQVQASRAALELMGEQHD